ncbi:hypothetical protein HMPREF9444_01018 [Succinatimonas hippei YIT 12066]|uniref:Uncharacterized protein n=1 Tax=Succinatimonas hippei (strain DSM 22608 / JCM 16073 / KCTC 15190 / YIT 12066) TaxID=762983 RepID=E8LJY3_SUCHY|nr:hypothetical protein HMPREF9444_01018 [Succinatimonas hippei YIT 12066]
MGAKDGVCPSAAAANNGFASAAYTFAEKMQEVATAKAIAETRILFNIMISPFYSGLTATVKRCF